MSGSPDCSIDRTFSSTFYFPHKVTKSNKSSIVYRNPIYLAKEYESTIESGKAKNQSELGKLKGISRARVTQICNLLKLDSCIIQKLEKLGDPFKSRIITERILRAYVDKSFIEQIKILVIL